MQVPDLVDGLARRNRRRRDDGEEAEAAIGIDGRAGVLKSPAMVAREPSGEVQRCVWLEIMLLDTPPKVLSGWRPDRLVRLHVDLELCPLQRRF
jgi:hypothetical protein